MCGLILAETNNGARVSKMLLKRYHKQSKRGKQGFGYIPVEDGYIKRVERFTTEKDFIDSLKKETSSEIMVHHRLPTSTENFIGTTHPVVVEDKEFEHKYYVIHNGTLRNEYTMKEDHEKLGLEYNTVHKKKTIVQFKGMRETISEIGERFLDSEAFAKDLALYLEGFQNEFKSKGTIAFMCYQTDKDGKVLARYYGHNKGRDLVSERVVPKKKKKTGYEIIKSEGGGVHLEKDVIFMKDYTDGKKYIIEVDIGEDYTVGYNVSRNIQSGARPSLPPRRDDIKFPPMNGEKGSDVKGKKDLGGGLLDDFTDEKGLFDMDGYLEFLDKSIGNMSESEIEGYMEDVIAYDVELDQDKKLWESAFERCGDSDRQNLAQSEINRIEYLKKNLISSWNTLSSELQKRESESVMSPYQAHLDNMN